MDRARTIRRRVFRRAHRANRREGRSRVVDSSAFARRPSPRKPSRAAPADDARTSIVFAARRRQRNSSGVQGVDDAFRLPRDARDDDSTSGDASRRGDATRRRRNPRRARRRDEDSTARWPSATRGARSVVFALTRSSRKPTRERRRRRARSVVFAEPRSSFRRGGGLVRQGEVRRRDVRGDDVPDDSTRGGGASRVSSTSRRRRDVPDDSTRGGGASRGTQEGSRGDGVQRAWRGFAGRRVVAEAREAEARRREAEARRRAAAATTAQRHVRGWIARKRTST